ncbi:hypothetical protein G7Y89_g8175 [Cudoniella acicularis]|uniref:Uncharacterized protein n=1 Tax=Cudoniella acicularis TaxID=354080 RepID=A0A8H4W1A9_9HELO|nr:hypothetical protein G7Y89_g8175 [Cudoniella acicularis]
MSSANILRNGFVGVDSVNFWLATNDTFDVRGLDIKTRALSFQVALLDQHALLALSVWKSGHFSDPTVLDQVSENIFLDTKLESGDIMVVLSSKETLELHNLEVGNGAMLVIARMSMELLQQFAIKLGVTFTPSEYGVYKKVFRPNTHIFTLIRNRLWSLSGVVTTIGTLYGRALDADDLAGVKWKAASADAVQRAKVDSKEADTERSGTAVGQAETAHGAIDETALGS